MFSVRDIAQQAKEDEQQQQASRGRSSCRAAKNLVTLLDLCVSSLRRGHANLLCIVPILSDDLRREAVRIFGTHIHGQFCVLKSRS